MMSRRPPGWRSYERTHSSVALPPRKSTERPPPSPTFTSHAMETRAQHTNHPPLANLDVACDGHEGQAQHQAPGTQMSHAHIVEPPELYYVRGGRIVRNRLSYRVVSRPARSEERRVGKEGRS